MWAKAPAVWGEASLGSPAAQWGWSLFGLEWEGWSPRYQGPKSPAVELSFITGAWGAQRGSGEGRFIFCALGGMIQAAGWRRMRLRWGPMLVTMGSGQRRWWPSQGGEEGQIQDTGRDSKAEQVAPHCPLPSNHIWLRAPEPFLPPDAVSPLLPLNWVPWAAASSLSRDRTTELRP